MSQARRPSRDARRAAGKALRERVPRQQHAEWAPPHQRRDPVELVIEASQVRIREIVPIRYGRMVVSGEILHCPRIPKHIELESGDRGQFVSLTPP